MTTASFRTAGSSGLCLLAILLGAGCAGPPPVELTAEEPFTLDGPDLVARHGASGLGLRLGATGAVLDLHGADVGFHTVSVGDGEISRPVGDAEPELLCETAEGCGASVALHHDDFSERWDAHDRGFEQSWIFDGPVGGGEELVIELAVEGARPYQIPGQTGVWLDVGDGQVVGYDGLAVLDADDVTLPARLRVEGDRVFIHADVQDARWPVLVDPVVSTAAWSGVGEATWDTYGHALASGDFNGDGWGDLAVSATHNWGCPLDSAAGLGTIYVYYGEEDGMGEGGTTTEIAAPSTATCFGNALLADDLDRDGVSDLLVGSPGDNSHKGSVYIYKGVATTGLSTTSSASVSGLYAYDQLGKYMASGDLMGDAQTEFALGVDKNVTGATGYPYVLVYQGATPTYLRTLSSTSKTGRFGEEVEFGDTNGDGKDELLVGSVVAGAVRVYTFKSYTATPSYTTLSKPSGLLYFSSSIEVIQNGTSAAEILVSGETSSGVGRIYRCTVASCSSSTYLTDGVAGSLYGDVMEGLDLDQDGYTDLAVGARLTSTNDGAVYVYDNDAGSFSSVTTLSAPTADGYFGGAVAGVDEFGLVTSLAVGAQYASTTVGSSSLSTNGAAWLYTGY